MSCRPRPRIGRQTGRMLKLTNSGDGVAVTFSVADDRPTSLVGDFNDWDPMAHPMPRRSNGRRSVKVSFPAGSTATFRYLSDGGEFCDDPDGDIVDNGWGGTHTVVSIPG